MTITGLEHNYYLAGNDIWIKIRDFVNTPEKLEIKVKNIGEGKELPNFTLYPSPNNDFHFNICLPIRALFPEPEHLGNPLNTLQEFELIFTATLEDEEKDVRIFSKYFIRGGVEKHTAKNWYLNENDPLIIQNWVQWEGVESPFLPQRIEDESIKEFTPDEVRKIKLNGNCEYKIIKFLNSHGGYQYWVFEHFELKIKTKAEKTIPRIAQHLQEDNFRNLGIKSETQISLYTKTPKDLQPIITDLIQSIDVLLYNPSGTDNNSKWQRLIIDNNETLYNSFEAKYENKIAFSFSNQTTISL